VIAPGALVTCRQTGLILYVVDSLAEDGVRWHCRAKRVDQNGRHDISARTIGEGDLVLVRAAPVYEPHTMVEHEGRFHEVAADNGDSVELITPSSRYPLDGGHALHREAGKRITVDKATLTLELLR
jgi:hypothetical protein